VAGGPRRGLTRGLPGHGAVHREAAARFAASRMSLPAGPASLSDGTRSPRSASAAAPGHGSRRPATACCRSTTAIPENHRRAIGLSAAHLQAARRDADTRSGVSFDALFHRASQGLRAQRARVRVLAEGDPDVDAALASTVGCSPPPTSLTPPRPPLSYQTCRPARKVRRCPDCPIGEARSPA